jgi:phosphoribosylformimino-5-aminoimidazole carboxamide ribotide isomerase
MEIIPSFDLMDGKLVRLRQGDFDQKKEYANDPLELAKELEQSGIRRLHIVDLDGARTGSPANLGILEKVASNTHLLIDYGGGIRINASGARDILPEPGRYAVAIEAGAIVVGARLPD